MVFLPDADRKHMTRLPWAQTKNVPKFWSELWSCRSLWSWCFSLGIGPNFGSDYTIRRPSVGTCKIELKTRDLAVNQETRRDLPWPTPIHVPVGFGCFIGQFHTFRGHVWRERGWLLDLWQHPFCSGARRVGRSGTHSGGWPCWAQRTPLGLV